MCRYILSCRQALGCVISVMRPSSTSFAAIQPVSCPSKIPPGRQWLPVFRPNGSLLPSVSPIMWLSVVTDGVTIQYQWRPHSVPIAPSFSTNGVITARTSSHCMPMTVVPLFVIRCHTVIYIVVLRICHSRPLLPSHAINTPCEPSSAGKKVSCASSVPCDMVLFLVACVGRVGRTIHASLPGIQP